MKSVQLRIRRVITQCPHTILACVREREKETDRHRQGTHTSERERMHDHMWARTKQLGHVPWKQGFRHPTRNKCMYMGVEGFKGITNIPA